MTYKKKIKIICFLPIYDIDFYQLNYYYITVHNLDIMLFGLLCSSYTDKVVEVRYVLPHNWIIILLFQVHIHLSQHLMKDTEYLLFPYS